MPGFITEWPLQDEKEGDDPLQRVSSKGSSHARRERELTFEEALRMGSRPDVRQKGTTTAEPALHQIPRRDSSSATTYSATPASLNSPSWSAGSFV